MRRSTRESDEIGVEEARGGEDLRGEIGDVKDSKLRERSWRAESGLNLIKAGGQDRQGQAGIRALESVTAHLFPSVNEASCL